MKDYDCRSENPMTVVLERLELALLGQKNFDEKTCHRGMGKENDVARRAPRECHLLFWVGSKLQAFSGIETAYLEDPV